MSFTSYCFSKSGPFIIGDSHLKHKIKDLINKRQKDPQKRANAEDILLNHPYIKFDERECAEQRERVNRSNKIKERLECIALLLGENKIKLKIPKGLTGTPGITVEKLERGHSIKAIDIDETKMLIRISRHPNGSKQDIHQFWLYNDKDLTLSIFKYTQKDISRSMKMGEVKEFINGKWQSPDETNKNNFENNLKKFLGAKSIKKFRQFIRYQPLILLDSIPEEVNEECKNLLSINLKEKEHKSLLEREEKYEKKYGKRQNSVSDYEFSFEGMKFMGEIKDCY